MSDSVLLRIENHGPSVAAVDTYALDPDDACYAVTAEISIRAQGETTIRVIYIKGGAQ